MTTPPEVTAQEVLAILQAEVGRLTAELAVARLTIAKLMALGTTPEEGEA